MIQALIRCSLHQERKWFSFSIGVLWNRTFNPTDLFLTFWVIDNLPGFSCTWDWWRPIFHRIPPSVKFELCTFRSSSDERCLALQISANHSCLEHDLMVVTGTGCNPATTTPSSTVNTWAIVRTNVVPTFLKENISPLPTGCPLVLFHTDHQMYLPHSHPCLDSLNLSRFSPSFLDSF